MLPYLYTLLHNAHAKGDAIMRALAWEFPDDIMLRSTDNQFLVGPSVLITPVLEKGATSVKGVFPGIGDGTRWYDWYTLQEVKGVNPSENVTMAAPLEHINVHIRGGSIIPMQQPAYTTAQNRANPYSLLVALDNDENATGSLYLDDGKSIEPDTTKQVNVRCLDLTGQAVILTEYVSSPSAITVYPYELGANILPERLLQT